ncbi:MAG: adenosylmethionine--8-amino-7-oxononanoate transaminase [Candidatus Nitrohelix vancouverensis]|uniref:Adenosylmethionine-8-amino-7-oxononanoate aminotransferase n=1 Tax=Candidatus Nitrohelix vancouverensis TaxID=2705534 RepID=A0A7T0C4G3_9BACT|nr:MAG: adenosylmethionine--8-amino-7-oxononanoate transaminase [Candidatus Nitrohelix vancouverensis]
MTMQENNDSPELRQDRQHVWHPCTPLRDHENLPPLLIDSADGIYLKDANGARYMDLISSWWVNLFGHNHPKINEAIEDQLKRFAHVMFAGITHRPATRLAERLVEHTPPNLTRVFFSDNGSTSIEVALKMSLQYWKQRGKPEKKRFLYLKGAYHGETLGALSVCGIPLFREKFEDVLHENIEVEGPDCFRCPYGLKRESCNAECFEPFEKALEEHAEQTAGAALEPLVQGAAGMKMYPPVYLKKLQAACDKAGVHTIFDEIAVGFGRTGSLFVCGAHELQPTFLCLSKGLTSGYLPLAATLTSEEIHSAFDGGFETLNWFAHSHSYTANPLACSAANASLDLFGEEGFWESLQSKVEAIGRGGERLQDLPWCGEFRQTGMIAAVELVQSKDGKIAFPFKERIGYKIYAEGLKRGVFMRPLGNVLYFMPPYIITVGEIERMVEIARDSIVAALRT